MRLLEVVEGAGKASLDAGHVLLREVGVVLGGGVWARAQQRHEGCRVVGRRGVGFVRFWGASLCWGRSVILDSHRSVRIPQVR